MIGEQMPFSFLGDLQCHPHSVLPCLLLHVRVLIPLFANVLQFLQSLLHEYKQLLELCFFIGL
jgi:hypothetical protein